MKKKYDFHTHTSASDGSLSPADLIEKAKAEGLEVIAITDHDTVGGLPEALEAGKALDLMVIPGVEISIDFSPGTLHMCGYLIDIESKSIRENLVFLQKGRANRNIEIVSKLNSLGMAITMKEVADVAGADVVGRPHFAKVLLDKGYVANTKDAFDRLLAKGQPCYVDRIRLSKKDALDMIKGSGGIAVLAHPGQLNLASQDEYRAFFKDLRDIGVDGIEAYSSHHSDEENKKFASIAQELSMLITGGSDFHRDNDPMVQLGVFGVEPDIDISIFTQRKTRN